MCSSLDLQNMEVVRHACDHILGPQENLSETQWLEAYSTLISSSTTHTQGDASHDDLLVLVHNHHSSKSNTSQKRQGEPFTVRRKQGGLAWRLAAEFSNTSGQLAQSQTIAWNKTFFLHLVLSAVYQLTVVACRQDALPRVAEGQLDGPDVRSVTRQVFASPSYTPVNLRKARADAPPCPCYPDICFAVDHEDKAFDAMVIERHDDAFCVLLHALPHPALATPKQERAQQHWIQLFSGYVTQQQVASYLASVGSRRNRKDARNKVVMNGPGGMGKSEVAVAHVVEAPKQPDATPASPHLRQISQPRPLFNLLQQGLKAASWLLEGDGDEARGRGSLQCALLTVVLPVDTLAQTIVSGS